jgi:hypothetical protein
MACGREKWDRPAACSVRSAFQDRVIGLNIYLASPGQLQNPQPGPTRWKKDPGDSVAGPSIAIDRRAIPPHRGVFAARAMVADQNFGK